MKKVDIDRTEALRYLGYRGKRPDAEISRILDECEDELQEIMRPAYLFRVLGVETVDGGIKVTGTELVLPGNDIAVHLRECDRVALMAATLSVSVDKHIKALSAKDMTKSIVTDALAGAAVETLCTKMEKEIFNKTRSFMTWRYSPGYGDLPLDVQPALLGVLNAQKLLGITVNDENMMIPRKSVTAIIGLSNHSIDLRRQGCGHSCDTCRLYQRCLYRD